MKYTCGAEVRVGDKVKLWDCCFGTVVASIDLNEYSHQFPENEWAYLKSGVLINSDKGGVIHYTENDEDLELIERDLS